MWLSRASPAAIAPPRRLNRRTAGAGRTDASAVRMELHADEPRMVRYLEDLRQKAVRRHAGEQQPAALQRADVVVHLVAVAVPFVDQVRLEDLPSPAVRPPARIRRRRAAWCRRDRHRPRAAPGDCRASTRSSCRLPARRMANSVDPAPGMPARLRAASTTAICMPKQMPKYGTERSRAKRAAAILPSAPRSPKPPGTVPCTCSRSGAPARRSRTPPDRSIRR